MIDHCEFPYGDEALGWSFGGPGYLTLALVFLLGVVVGALLLSMMRLPRRRRSEASLEEIWRTVNKAIAEADGMPDDRILVGLNQLIVTLERALGGVMKLGAEAQARLRGLRDAAEGKLPPPADPPADPHAPQQDATPLHPGPRAPMPVRIDQSVGSPHVDVTIIEAPWRSGPDGENHAKPRDLRQMLAEVRVAIGVFSNYWSNEAGRIADLRVARDNLLGERPRAG